MSSLQLGLIALGGVVILGLIAFNWWQERKIRRDMVRRFDGSIDDVLMGKSAPDALQEETLEEDFNTESEASVTHADVAFEADETTFTDAEPIYHAPDAVQSTSPPIEVPNDAQADAPLVAASPAPAASFLTAPSPRLPSSVDPVIDEIAIIALSELHTGSALRSHLNPIAPFGKPACWFGWSQNAWLPLTLEFEHRSFSCLVAAMQLADRSGAIQADSLLGFQTEVENLAAQVSGTLTWCESRETLRYANSLDQFCIEVDVTVTLHVMAGIEGPFSGTKLRGIIEAAGLTLREDGRFHQMNEAGEETYNLSNADQRPMSEDGLRTAALQDVVLMLDVPRVSKGSEVFRHMATLGARLETTLNARLTDANRRALGEAQIEQIRNQIQTIHGKMLAHNIIPGGASALRLFS